MRAAVAAFAGVLVAVAAASPATGRADPKALAEKHLCLACHKMDEAFAGPSYREVAEKYKGDSDALAKLSAKVKKGGKGVWGNVPMPPNKDVPDEDIKTIVAWALGMSGTPATAVADETAAKAIVATRCALCHGLEGEGTDNFTPRLAGQNLDYLVKEMLDFQHGRRKGTAMNKIAEALKENEVRPLAAYYSAKPAIRGKASDAELATVGRYLFHRGNPFGGVAPCAQCHGDKGLGTAKLPRLAGQQASYVEHQLRDFISGMRANDQAVMHGIAKKLGELEIKALAAYISSLE